MKDARVTSSTFAASTTRRCASSSIRSGGRVFDKTRRGDCVTLVCMTANIKAAAGESEPTSQACEECADWWRLWEQVRPLLTRAAADEREPWVKERPAKIRLPGRSRPVVMPEPVAIEDAVDGAERLVEHWREVVQSAPGWRGKERLKQHVGSWQNLLPDVLPRLQARSLDWPRRRTRAAEQVLAALLGEDQRIVHRWRGAYDNFIRSIDEQPATCEDCGRDIIRRRSEQNLRLGLLCSLCRERRWWTMHLRLDGWVG